MTLNITKKKIEKVLELFNHPQTRKIRKNRGKKRRRNNKSFNRKNGRKNLATSTLKKRGGQAGHHPSVGGQVGVVLGGQVGGRRGDVLKTIVSKLSDPLKTKLSEILLKADNKKKTLVAFVKQKLKITNITDKETEFTDLNNIKDNEFEVTTKDINDKDINDINISDISDKDIDDISDEVITEVLNDTSEKSINTEPSGLQQEKVEGDNQNQNQPTTEPEIETDNNKKPQQIQNKKVEKPKEESKNDKMMKLLTLREDYTIFNILNNLLPPKEEGQTADLKEIVKKLDFGKFVDEIGILKNDGEESTNINEGEGKKDNEEGEEE